MGVILGTAAYMSPEQAKGRAADKRSDVWAYGCVLYEMLTGKRAFEGEDVSDTLAAVLRADPDLSALPNDASGSIRTLIERCLEKDRRKRVADISTALFVLGEPSILKPPARINPTSGATLPPSRPLWRRLAPIAATALVSRRRRLRQRFSRWESRLLLPRAPFWQCHRMGPKSCTSRAVACTFAQRQI